MILPMKKYTMLIYHRDFDKYLDSLKDIGLLHIIEQEKDIIPDEVNFLKNKLSSLSNLLKELTVLKEENNLDIQSKIETLTDKDIQNLKQDFLKNKKIIEDNNNQIKQLQKEIDYLSPWGDFSLDKVSKIQESGIVFKLYKVSSSKLIPAYEKELPITIITKNESSTYFVLHHLEDEKIDVSFLDSECDLISLPEKSISDLKKEIRELEGAVLESKNELILFAKEKYTSLESAHIKIKENYNTEEAKSNALSKIEDKLKIIEGWIPEEEETRLVNFLDKHNIVFLSKAPDKEDSGIPIKLKNNKFASLFEPIGKLFSLPAYQEIDLTPLFAPFFMFFFGFCLGDAGYGAVVLLAATIAKFKIGSKLKPAMTLLQLLGFSTIVMGVAGGTVFGISLIENEKDTMFLTSQNLFFFSVIVGIIQILFGMVVKAFNMIKQKGHLYAVSTYGWILMTLSLIGMGSKSLLTDFGGYSKDVVNSIELLTPIENISTPIFFLGLALLLFFNNPNLNIFKRFGLGLWEFYGITGLLGDVLSYLRLYALGLSSGILGLVINSLGNDLILEAIPIPGLNYLLFAIFLILAHAGNLGLAFLGSFVHPMRLTFVEFYKNTGWEGGGFEFKPFAKVDSK